MRFLAEHAGCHPAHALYIDIYVQFNTERGLRVCMLRVSSVAALHIHVSPECKAHLDKLGGFHLKERGIVEMKVRGLYSVC